MKKIIYIGDKIVGDGKITIQSMTNTPTTDIEATKAQIIRLKDAGADFVRVSVPNMESAGAIKLLSDCGVPLIGDIHFRADAALAAIENGISKIRVNPSNLPEDGLRAVVKKCAEYGIPIRVGVNKGSVKGNISAEQLVNLTLDAAKRIEDFGWNNLVLAVKTSDPSETVASYRLLAKSTDYPLHIGLTESGTESMGLIKSVAAIGSLLIDGIGDTVRVSLTGDPVREIVAAKKILRAVGIDRNFADIVSCPTCARTEIDVLGLAESLEQRFANTLKPLKIAVMGCVVNGVGEGKDADFGVAGGKNKSVIFKKGQIYKTVYNSEIEHELLKLAEEFTHD